MSFKEIKDIIFQRDNASTQHDRDFSNICIEWMRTLPMEAAAGVLFQTPEGETTYLNSIGVLLELASEFEKNKSTIGHICAEIDRIPLSPPVVHNGAVNMCQILREIKVLYTATHDVSHIMTIYRDMKNTIIGILAITDPVHKKMLVNLFDRYILSLAIVGQEKALSCHQPLTNIGRRNTSDTSSGYIIQSIANPDFSMRDFLLKGPISMFYGYREPVRYEIICLSHCFWKLTTNIPINDSHFRNSWANRQYMYSDECKDVVRIIQGLSKEKYSASLQFKKLYPHEHLNLARVLTRLV